MLPSPLLAALLTVSSVVLLSGTAVRAQDETIDCTSQSLNMMQLDQCAGREFKAAEVRLDTLYLSMMAKYDAPNRALLEAAQKSWRAWRDAECEYETNGTAGGTINSMMQTKCRTAKTSARLKELDAQLHCEEGDLSCNAPRQ
jgi:uncharacterized protein YecT (DUF1311 family)